MSFESSLAAAEASAFARLGRTVTHDGAPVVAIVDRNVAIVDQSGQVMERRTEITVRKSQVELDEGDTIIDGEVTYTVTAILSDDGYVQTAAAK